MPMTPMLIIVGVWGIAAVGALAWVAGRLASLVSGHGWNNGPGFGWGFAQELVGRHFDLLWPGVPPTLVGVLFVVLLVLAVAAIMVPWTMLSHRRRPADDPLPSLAQPRDVAALAPQGAAERAIRLRPSLRGRKPKQIPPTDVGLLLGHLTRFKVPLRASWEDVLLAIMAPRAGKTTALAVPAILDAPGSVVATSNKSDLWAATSGPRAEEGTVWVFDPQAIAHHPQTFWWNPLAGVTTVEEAHRLATHFIQEIRDERTGKDFWSAAAQDLLTALMLAAATSDSTLTDVYRWLNDSMLPEPVELLRCAGHPATAASLQGRQNGAPETREGVYETARTAAQCLRDPQIMAWVTPPSSPKIDEFDADGFATSADTLYLMSKDGAGAASPLIAALTDRVMREAVRHAEARGGRLDPPMVVALDEAANVCKISDLPDLYSHLGSRGIVPLTILQSYRQGVRVWGEPGMDTLWSAATCKVLGAGIDDARLAEDISRLVGEHDVSVSSYSSGSHRGSFSESVQLRRQRILPPDAIRALPRGSALVLATGVRAAMITLQPWYTSGNKTRISAALAAAEQTLTERAARTQRARQQARKDTEPAA